MAQKKQPFDVTLTLTAAAGSNDVRMARVDAGWLYCLQRIAVENQTSVSTDVRLLVAGGGEEVLIAEQDTPLAATLYWIADPAYISEGRYLLARFSGCTAGDLLKVYLTGWKQKSLLLEED